MGDIGLSPPFSPWLAVMVRAQQQPEAARVWSQDTHRPGGRKAADGHDSDFESRLLTVSRTSSLCQILACGEGEGQGERQGEGQGERQRSCSVGPCTLGGG